MSATFFIMHGALIISITMSVQGITKLNCAYVAACSPKTRTTPFFRGGKNIFLRTVPTKSKTYLIIKVVLHPRDQCRGRCAVSYGGQYKSTPGFEKHSCTSDIQSGNYIRFWSDWSAGDGAVMMIGGGGSGCNRADHGVGKCSKVWIGTGL